MRKSLSLTELLQGLHQYPIGAKFYVEYNNWELEEPGEPEVIIVKLQGEKNKVLCWEDGGQDVPITSLMVEASYTPVEKFENISFLDALKAVLSGKTEEIYVTDNLGFTYPTKLTSELLESVEDSLGKGMKFLKLVQETTTDSTEEDA